jgi:chemotaxis signal transduction protein
MTDDTREMTDPIGTEPTMRKLRLFTRGSVEFAILENEVTALESWRAAAPLPNAPDSVLGVVGIQGRMLTVLDLAQIAGAQQGREEAINQDGQQRILALRGDEQLALIVDAERESVDISDETVRRSMTHELLSTINHAGVELKILNPKQLFASAIQGRERRRRRF